jgi:hypothetical protein
MVTDMMYSLGKFPANSNLCTKLTSSKSSGKSSSELIVLASDWSEFERKCVGLQADRVELTGFCTVKALNPLALLGVNQVGFGRISTTISSELNSICLESIEWVNEFERTPCDY